MAAAIWLSELTLSLAQEAAPAPPKSTAPLGSDGRMPVLIVSGSDTYHDWRATTPQLRTLLETTGRCDARIVEDAEALGNPALLARYRVVILNGQAATSTPALRRALAGYVRAGGGLVAIHWAVDNFRDWPGFTDLLGRTWSEGTSVEEHGSFRIQPTRVAHAVTAGMAAWTTPVGEAIHYRLRGRAPLDVLATATSPRTGEAAPVMIAHGYGRGRTFFTPLGHNAATRADPYWQTMIVRAVRWAAGGASR